jgi:hypothetical protein
MVHYIAAEKVLAAIETTASDKSARLPPVDPI